MMEVLDLEADGWVSESETWTCFPPPCHCWIVGPGFLWMPLSIQRTAHPRPRHLSVQTVSGKVNKEELQGTSLRGSPGKCYEYISPSQRLQNSALCLSRSLSTSNVNSTRACPPAWQPPEPGGPQIVDHLPKYCSPEEHRVPPEHSLRHLGTSWVPISKIGSLIHSVCPWYATSWKSLAVMGCGEDDEFPKGLALCCPVVYRCSGQMHSTCLLPLVA
jgi:hypothetical protein